jgi:hypothetical protein
VNLTHLYCDNTNLATQLEVYGQPENDGYGNLNYIHLLKKAQQSQTQNQVEITTNNK